MAYKLIFSLFLACNLFAEICEKHPIYCQILDNRPTIDKKYAMELSNIIFKHSKKYKLDSQLYTAILCQESKYKLGAKNCAKGLAKFSEFESKVMVCFDFGISQINYITANNYGFEINKLMNDLDYSVKAGAIVLHDILKIWGNKEKDAWTRYNSPTNEFRKIYKDNVMRWM